MSGLYLGRLVARFAERFGGPPKLAARAPGRVNLIGEHTDYNGGLVLPIAIDRHVVTLAAPAGGDVTTAWAIDLEPDATATAVIRPDGTDPEGLPPFARYIAGVLHELERLGRPVPALNLAVTGDLPVGAGLASSAALEVATVTALESLGPPMASIDKALLCQRAEHRFGGTPCGIMDMLVSIAARPAHAMLIDCRSNTWKHVPLPRELAILVANTGVTHELASTAYAERRATCVEAARRLGVESLRDVEPGNLHADGLTDTQRRRAEHVVAENGRVVGFAAALDARDLDAAGRILFEGHASLRDLFEVSCSELDALVNSAAELTGKGVFGARMTGGGFGGCGIVLCAPDAIGSVTRHLIERFERRFGAAPTIFRVDARPGARPLTDPAGPVRGSSQPRCRPD